MFYKHGGQDFLTLTSKCPFSNYQEFLDCQDVLVETAEIKTLNRVHVETNRYHQD